MEIKKLKIIHWNCNSIVNKLEEFKYFLEKYKPDIITLNETKINDFNANINFIQISEFNFIHKQRHELNGAGGVAILIHKSINFEQITLFDNLHLELLAINIHLKNKDLSLVAYYNPPNVQLSETVFHILSKQKNNFIVLGDLNSKSDALGCVGTNKNGSILEKIICEHDCLIINNNDHTYFSFRTASNFSDKIDFAIISAGLYNQFNTFSVLKEEDMTSDHVPILVELKCEKKKFLNQSDETLLMSFNFNKANWNKYKINLPKTVPLECFNDVEKLNKYVVKSMIEAAKFSIPVRQIYSQHKHTLPEYLVLIIKKRKSLRKEFIKHNNLEKKKMYNSLTKIIREELKAMKNIEWQQFIAKQGKNPLSSKPFWKKINKLRGHAKSNTIPTLKKENDKFENDSDKANLFADILKNTFSDHNDDRFDHNFKKKVELEIENHDFSLHDYSNENCFTIKDLNETIKKLKNFSAPGQDGIHNMMLKNLSLDFRHILLRLINLTIQKSLLPNDWKSSTITMIPKKKSNSSDPKDYRPISLTSNLAKLAEKMIAIKLKDFLKQQNIIIKQQSGFRSFRQTKDNLFFISQKIIEQFNRGKKVCGIFFDIASAFDKVWHKGIIYKLLKLKTPSFIVCWLKNFLENRIFNVKINNSLSQAFPITAGVPQGAALSPILFSIFINDIPILHSKNKDYSLLFADDLVFLNCFKKFGNAQAHINKYLKKLECWLQMWRLLMAPQKCNFTIFSKYHGDESVKFNLQLFNTNLTVNDSPTFLGIRFDKQLTFKNQISYLQKSCINRLNFLKIVSKKNFGLETKTLDQLYVSLVRSILEYSSILSPIICNANFNKLNIIQNKAIKIIHKKPMYTSMKEINSEIQNLNERFDTLNLKYLTNSIKNKNELIIEVCKDYLELVKHRPQHHCTILCKYKLEIAALL